LVVVTMLAAFVSLASVAVASIVIQKSIAGVRLGVSENDVVATLGQPRHTTNLGSSGNPAGQPQKALDYGLTDVTITGGVVTEVKTTSQWQKTSNNVRVGISETALRSKVAGLSCHGSGYRRFCIKGALLPGKPITTFSISAKKKVKAISLATIID
jgi:hypothetical protein